jgi:hypothetical protein
MPNAEDRLTAAAPVAIGVHADDAAEMADVGGK